MIQPSRDSSQLEPDHFRSSFGPSCWPWMHPEEAFSTSGRTIPLRQGQRPVSVQIIGQITQTNPGYRPVQAESSQEQVLRSLGLDTEDIFNPGANARPRPVSLLLPSGKLMMEGAFALQPLPVPMGAQPRHPLPRTIGGVCHSSRLVLLSSSSSSTTWLSCTSALVT